MRLKPSFCSWWLLLMLLARARSQGPDLSWRDLSESNYKRQDILAAIEEGDFYYDATTTPSTSLLLSSRSNVYPKTGVTDSDTRAIVPVNVRLLIDRAFAADNPGSTKPKISKEELIERLPVIMNLLKLITGKSSTYDENDLITDSTWLNETLCERGPCDRRGKSRDFGDRTTRAEKLFREAEVVTSASMTRDQRRFLGILLNRVQRNIEEELSTIPLNDETPTETPGVESPPPPVKVNEGPSEGTRQNNPSSIDEIITGIVQLLGGNVRVSKPPAGFRLRPSATGNRRVSSKRVNDRGPALFPLASTPITPPSIIEDGPSLPSMEMDTIVTSELSAPLLKSSLVIVPSISSAYTTTTTPLPETSSTPSTSSESVALNNVFVEVNEPSHAQPPSILPKSSVRIRIFSTPVMAVIKTTPIESTKTTQIDSTKTTISTPTESVISISETEIVLTTTKENVQPSTTQQLSSTAIAFGDTDIVYGKPVETEQVRAPGTIKPTKTIPERTTTSTRVVAPLEEEVATLTGTGTMYKPLNKSYNLNPQAPTGRPYVVPVEIEEVRPFIGAYPNRPGRPGEFGVGGARKPPSSGQPPHKDGNYPGRPGYPGGPPLSNRPQGFPEHNRPPPRMPPPNRKPQTPPIRSPPIRPRPHPPLVRIDTCIVGDDSTCDVQLNEKCVTELGVSSCHCRPGLARTIPRGPCNPVVSVSMAIKIDRISDRPITFNKNYLDTSSDEYRIMEQETNQALSSLFSYTSFSRTFMGATINKFHPANGGLLVNTTIQLEENESNKNPVVQRLLQQEILNAITSRNLNIGDSSLYLNSPPRQGPLVQDLNECELVTANDCSANGICQNTFGSFRCVCKPGFMDKNPNESWKSGRACSVCSPTMCSNHGECVVNDGKRECKCRGNYIGARCEIDGEVLGVALGASLAALVIIILTLVCLCVWNRRWKRDQHKAAIAPSPYAAYTISKKNCPAPGATHVRVSVEDRMRWAHIADAMGNIYIQQHDGLPGTSSPPALPPPPPPQCPSMKHIYATPSRLLLQKASEEERNRHYGHVRPKSRNQLLVPVQNNSGGYYDLNEFPTRDPYGSPHYGNPNISQPSYY